MKKVKITVLRATFNEDLALEYGMPGLKPCSVMKQGQVFYAAHAKPDGFCDGAWRTIYQYVFALANGARSFYYNDWIRQPGVAIACCNDGLRPCFSSWRPPTRRSERRSIRERVGMTPCGIGAIIHWNGRAFDVCHICGGRTTGCEIL